MHRTTRRRALTTLLLALGARLNAQSMEPYVPVRPNDAWRTLETAHFVFHFPRDLDEWTRDVATRIEGERDAVRRLVGFAPPERVTVLVADPYNVANGSAYPFLHAPTMFFWPVPDEPRGDEDTGHRWADLLAIHEFAHVAHLARPSRNPLRRALDAALPTQIGPIGFETPRWVWEGYATYVEGALTGGGRPFGAWRPAFLRQWALEGKLPTYAAVSAAGGFAGGEFAYYAGSAYFEWLVAQRGDSSLPHIWRRLTARTSRTFDEAFAGVFPGTPAELYARWSAEVTAEAVAAERALREAPGGLVEGALVQRLRGATGDPAVSPDGQRVALVVRSPGRASRVVVWRTGPEPRDTTRRGRTPPARTRPRQRVRDLEDVPAVPYLPPPKRPLATLRARDGRAFGAPRWLPDGERVLVQRYEPLADGRLRPDLWLWDTQRHSVRRLTRGAGVRDADPSPDGLTALGVRCLRGWCDLARVSLGDGAVTTLAAGSPERTFARPRWAPDGKRFVVAEQRTGRWHVVLGELGAGEPTLRDVGPVDGTLRYDPVFLRDGRAIVVTSERGGVPNLERVDLATGGLAPLTRVTGAAVAAEPIGATRDLYFLSLRSTGFDLRRLALDSVPPSLAVVPLVSFAERAGARGPAPPTPIAPRVATGPGASAAASAVGRRLAIVGGDSFPATPVAPSRPYGLGPQRLALLPAGAWTADGNSLAGVLAGADPVGRLTWVLVGAFGAPSTWRGGSLSAALRALPVTVDAQAFVAAQRYEVASGVRVPLGTARDDVHYRGGLLALAPRATLGSATLAARLGGSLGTVLSDAETVVPDREWVARKLAFADARASLLRGSGDWLVSTALGATGATGRSAGRSFTRTLGSAAVAIRTPLLSARASYAQGAIGADAPPFERFTLGGPESAIVDASLLGQRIAMPVLPTGTLTGRRVEVARVGLGGYAVEPFAWASRVPDATSAWLRVVGAEASFTSGPVPFARAPGARLVGGVGYTLDGPTRHRAQIYASVAARP